MTYKVIEEEITQTSALAIDNCFFVCQPFLIEVHFELVRVLSYIHIIKSKLSTTVVSNLNYTFYTLTLFTFGCVSTTLTVTKYSLNITVH